MKRGPSTLMRVGLRSSGRFLRHEGQVLRSGTQRLRRTPTFRSFGSFMRDRRWFFIAVAVGAVLLLFAPPPSGLTLSDTLGLGLIAIMGASVFLIVGLVQWNDLNNGVNWGVVLLYASAISLGLQMKETGAALWVADSFLGLVKPLGFDHGIPLWTAVSALTTGVTNTMSNGAAVAVLGPINLKLAEAAGESPMIIGFITAVSSAFAYLTVIGTPACTIVYSAGFLKTTDFLKVGFRMVIMSTLILLLSAYFYWPLLGA